ncbi:MAG TPA: hypothetical protein VF655_11940 [Allosphingosinicella sp.]|jgi:hypothetical protein
MKPVGKILDVAITPLAGGDYFVEAVGQVGSGGWSRPALVSRGAIITADGTLEYDFLAQPPPSGSMNTAVMARHKASANFGGPGTDIRGLRRVRIYAAGNYMDCPLPRD